MAAFEAAIALGYRYLETDVHRTADGALVAIHDPTLDRITDRTGRVATLPLHAVREADAGYRFTTDGGATFPFRGRGLTVPSLREVLERWPDVNLNIDAKADDAVAPLVRLIEELNAYHRVSAGSFSDRRVARVRRLSGGRLCTSMGQRAVAIAWASSRTGRMPRSGADCVQVPIRWRGVRIVDHRFVRAAHAAGLQVHVWTVDSASDMRMLLDLGVDGIMSDRPTLLRAVLAHRGQWTDAAE